jgi:hypothetical protein
MKYLFLMLMTIVGLMGCTTTKTEMITVTKSVFIEVPSDLTQPCEVTTPPSISEYEQLSARNKEYHLAMYATTLLQDISICSNKITKIGQWSKDQSAIFLNQGKEVKNGTVN